MDINNDWARIRTHFKKSIYTNLHVSIASIDENNKPLVTPIGSLFLNKDETTGYYFERYPSRLPRFAKTNKSVTVLSVNSGLRFWFSSLRNVKFKYPPAIKLYGELGERREATELEIKKLHHQLRAFRFFKKGYSELWEK